MRSLIYCLFFLTSSTIFCQTSSVSNYIWLSCGPGVFHHDELPGFSLYSGLNWSRNKIIETNTGQKRRNNMMELRFIDNFKVGDENLFGHISELDLLYGKSFGKILQLSISGGIGVIGGEKMVDHGNDPFGTNGNYKREYFTTLNFPIEAGLYLNPIKYFGIGIKRFASLNTKQSLNGYLLTFKFGKVR